MDIKGTAWIAAFPTPNITVQIFRGDQPYTDQIPGEDTELAADKCPHEFDFLGRDIDCGFRLAKFSTADKLVLSDELALALCDAAAQTSRRVSWSFNYLQRAEMKGIISGKPYPIVTIDTIRCPTRRTALELENLILRRPDDVKPGPLGDFLRTFLKIEGLDTHSALFGEQAPDSYREFQRIWRGNIDEVRRRSDNEDTSADQAGADNGSDVLDDVQDLMDTMVSEARGRMPKTTLPDLP
ncbi:MAG: hypothetical protein FWD68_16515 [Alphaproteobacteria bacterium]|nr:hypothetical protein [Alphaproteobacteria bacterium]